MSLFIHLMVFLTCNPKSIF